MDTFTLLLAFRVLMVWVYEYTGSLLVAMLMHGSATACTLIFWPVTTGLRLLMFDIAIATALWIAVVSRRERPAIRIERTADDDGVEPHQRPHIADRGGNAVEATRSKRVGEDAADPFRAAAFRRPGH